MLDTDAGEDPTDPKFVMNVEEGSTQFCACAPEAANSETANAIPMAVPTPRPRRRESLPNPVGI
jgi:hypothetical protein